MAVERGIPVLINDVYQPDHPLLPLIDVLVISAEVARNSHAENNPLKLADQLVAAGDCHVIVTAAGADIHILSRAGERAVVSPPSVSPVDTTGAGDIFKSGLLYGMLNHLPLREAVKWGAAAGSLMCQFAGTTKTLAPSQRREALLDTIEPRSATFLSAARRF